MADKKRRLSKPESELANCFFMNALTKDESYNNNIYRKKLKRVLGEAWLRSLQYLSFELSRNVRRFASFHAVAYLKSRN